MDDRAKIEQFLSNEYYMVIATLLGDGTPWAVPVRILKREGAKIFEWDSKLDTEHSKSLEGESRMAITIFRKFEDAQIGFYAKGHGQLVQVNDNDSGRYRFTAEEAWINDQTFIKRQVF